MAQTVSSEAPKATTSLKPAQQRRALALQTARDVLSARSLTGGTAVDSFELIRVADYILEGEPA